ncbi:MAG: sulfatase [Phycisphaeraceae bacterium]|nr:sulfatase [Phycisphaeraceae bacterium]
MRHPLVVGALALTTSPTTILAQSAAPAQRMPNVLVIISDDGGYGDWGCYGVNDLRTPNVDALARDGVRMTNGYVTASVCSPSRAGLLTGRYQQRFGHECNIVDSPAPAEGFTVEQVGLSVDQKTIGNAMQDLGYRTIEIGKWHMGNHEHFLPWNRGFDDCYALPEGGRNYWPYLDGVAWPKYIFVEKRPQPEQDITYLTDSLSDAAVRYIENARDDQPFFMYLAYTAVHTPMQAKDEDMADFDQIDDKQRRTYAGMMKAMDDGIGRVRAALVAKGLTDNTLIFFINDNGGATNNSSTNGPLRGSKGTKWEGGIRVPFIITWPGRLPAGLTYEKPVISLDILPTAIAASGQTWQTDKALDGVNLLPYLTGDNDADPHDVLFWRRGVAAAMREGDWKLIRVETLAPMLFNLADDIGETTDLAGKHPKRVQRMLEKLDAWEAELAPLRWNELDRWSQWQIEKHAPAAVAAGSN